MSFHNGRVFQSFLFIDFDLGHVIPPILWRFVPRPEQCWSFCRPVPQLAFIFCAFSLTLKTKEAKLFSAYIFSWLHASFPSNVILILWCVCRWRVLKAMLTLLNCLLFELFETRSSADWIICNWIANSAVNWLCIRKPNLSLSVCPSGCLSIYSTTVVIGNEHYFEFVYFIANHRHWKCYTISLLYLAKDTYCIRSEGCLGTMLGAYVCFSRL